MTISDQLQALKTIDSYVITSNKMAGQFEGSASMGIFVMLSLATEWLDSLREVLVWKCLLTMLETLHFLDKGYLCNVEHRD